MKKIEIYLDDNIFLALQTYAQAINASTQEACQLLIAANTSLFLNKAPSIKPNIHQNIEEDEFDELKEHMNIYNITQLDLASFLKITQAGVSFAITKKKKSSIIFRMIEKLGIEKFLLKVIQHKYVILAELEIIPNNSNIDFFDYTYKDSSSYTVLKNWPQWKKVVFGYIINAGYINEEGDDIPEDEIFETIDNLSDDKSKILIQAEEAGLDSYLSALRQIYEHKED